MSKAEQIAVLRAELRGEILAGMMYEAAGKVWMAQQSQQDARELSARLYELTGGEE